MKCIYALTNPTEDTILCDWYYNNMVGKNNGTFLHFPNCCHAACPLCNPNIIAELLATEGVKLRNKELENKIKKEEI